MMNRNLSQTVYAALVAIALGAAPALAVVVDFDDGDGGDSDWNSALNWDNDAVPTAADDVFIGQNGGISGNQTITITANPLNQIDELGLGRNEAGAIMTINHSAGALVTNFWTNIGQNAGDHGIYNLSGGSVTHQTDGNNVLGGFGSARGELHITNGGTWSNTTGFTAVGGEVTGASTAIGIITVSDTGVFENTAGTVFIGRGGTGSYTQTSSATSKFTGGGLEIGNLAQGMGTVTVSNGILEVAGADIQIGRGNTTNKSELNIDGTGSVTHTINTVIGRDGRGLIDISGNGSFSTNRIIVGEGGATIDSDLNISGSATLASSLLELGLGGSQNGAINITGSSASITTQRVLVYDENTSNQMNWIADASGISAINAVAGGAEPGTVELSDAVLSVDLTAYTGGDAVLTLINNDLADAVIDTFAGLAEGATVLGTGYSGSVTISYVGGGNDVILTLTGGSASIPTPTPAALPAGLALLGLGAMRRRR